MNFLILGAGAEELGWARAIARDPRHALRAAYPGFEELPGVHRPSDLDDALAVTGVEAVVVGGALRTRGEWLRRVAAEGLPVLCLHPPGEDSEAYYQVALSHAETGAIVIPALAIRLHPALDALRHAMSDRALGDFHSLRVEWSVASDGGDGDLARFVFPRLVDGVRALMGEVEAVTANGDPPGPQPTRGLFVHLRGAGARRAEIRIESGPPAPGRIVVTGALGSLTLEYPPDWDGPARLVSRTSGGAGTSTAGGETVTITELDRWDPHTALLAVLADAAASHDSELRPNLGDGTRAMELSEATVRSLKRGRTVDLHYEEISEASTFKSVMTSTGCVIFLAALAVLPAALIGPPLGFPATLYLAYAIPPVLVLFMLFQCLRFAVRSPREDRRGPHAPRKESTSR